MLADKTEVIGLIPARGGSKGIKNKNIIDLNGQPMMSYTINAALESKKIDQVWVSSDDPFICEIARKAGSNVMTRPENLADDSANATSVVEHFLGSLSERAISRDAVIVYLQPTSPLRTATHIDSALAMLEQVGSKALVSVRKSSVSPYKALRLDESNLLESLFDERLSNANRQDLPDCYFPNGAIYAFLVSEFRSRGGFPTIGACPFLMSDDDSIDVDSFEDLEKIREIMGEKNG
jgi:CMP-N,N'-diacetyllegionaminic acid synthase